PAGLSASTFPAKLRRLVNSPHVRSVCWDSQAQGLLIDRSLFEWELLSMGGGHRVALDSFKAMQFHIIVCQLNHYGFQKLPGQAGAAVPGDA
ncbi:HSF5 protein, partial [Picathartes gymnocephalus]|nr:HSF5 protein [Picathartes gymnocephalus]